MIREQDFEYDVLAWLDDAGWETYGNDQRDGGRRLDEEYGRNDKETVIYWPEFEECIIRINDYITSENVERVTRKVQKTLTEGDDLMEKNRAFHSLLRGGVTVTVDTDNGVAKRTIKLVDFETHENNSFIAANQFRVAKHTTRIRPDVVLFVNGIPLVVTELKSRAQGNTYEHAVNDLHEYEESVPKAFVPSLFNVAASNLEFRYGAIRAPLKHYNPWRPPEVARDTRVRPEAAFKELCSPGRVLNILHEFVFYHEDAGTTAKIVPRHPQYYAKNAIVHRVEDATARTEANKRDGVDSPNVQGRGLIWHTQGSGKSFAMLYTARSLVQRHGAQVLIVVDTDDLNEQMKNDIESIGPGFGNHAVAQSKSHLQKLIETGRSGIVITTIQKFEEMPKDAQGNDTTVVMADEAHRFMEADLGTRLEAALNHAHHFGFTGTPVDERERNTWVNYQYDHADSDELYLHRYSTVEACEEGVITRVNIEARDDIEWTGYSDELDAKHRKEFTKISETERQKRIQEEIGVNSRSELSSYVEVVTDDIVDHFRQHVLPEGFKGMVVTRSRRSAALYGGNLKRKLGDDNVRVLYTDMEGDDERLAQFHTTTEERTSIVDEFKRPGESPLMLVVCDMLLTGFDAPILRTMYLDRPIQNHNLLQAIARTNRTQEGKEFGEIIDYTGITRDIDGMFEYAEDEMDAYLDEDKDEFIEQYEALINDIFAMFDGLDRDDREGTAVFNKWYDCLDTEPKLEQFLQKWRKLKRLRANIAPDERLLKDGERLEDDYRWIQALAQAVDTSQPPPQDDFRSRTLELVDEYVEVYKESEGGEHVRTINGADIEAAPVRIARKKDDLLDTLDALEQMSPKYKMLSEKVQEIAVRWNDNSLTSEEALERLRELEVEVEQAEQELAGSTREERAREAINALLDEEYGDALSADESTESVAELVLSVYQQTEEQMRGAFEEKLRERHIRNLRTALAKDDPEPKEMGLAMSDEFLEDAVYYLDETVNTRIRAL